MSEATPSRRPRIGPWLALGLFVLIWIADFAIGPILRSHLQPYFEPKTAREIVAFRMGLGLPLSWAMLGMTILILRLRGQRPADIGWGKRAAVWGWLAAALAGGFFIIQCFHLPHCRGLCFIDPTAWLTDWSVYRTVLSVSIGVTAGICEETMFRGFVMSQARDGGAPVIVQVLLSGLLFGLAHFGIGGLSGQFNLVGAISAVASTTVFGIVFAVIYLLSRRSLMPGILAHGLFAFAVEPWMLLWVLSHSVAK